MQFTESLAVIGENERGIKRQRCHSRNLSGWRSRDFLSTFAFSVITSQRGLRHLYNERRHILQVIT